jgi:hemerythrin superfamily protein
MKRAEQVPSLFERIEADHDAISTLFLEMEEALDQTAESVRPLLARLRDTLKVHAQAEEEAVYSTLRQDEEASDLAEESLEEHREVDDILAELEALGIEDEEWGDTFQELKDAVDYHVEGEETDLFGHLRSVFEPERLLAIAEAYEDAKEKYQRILRAA